MIFGKRFPILLLVMACAFFSCYKTKEIYIMKGEWVVTSVELDGGKTNQMYSILPYYDETTSKYLVYFGDDEQCNGQYYIKDDLNYAVEGTWALLDKDHIYLEVDNYVKGVFELEKKSANEMVLYAKQNIISFSSIGEVEMIVRVRRD